MKQGYVQVYTGNGLRPPFVVHGSVSLETQAFPDSVNKRGDDGKPKAGWPDVVLRPGQVCSHKMIHRFSAALKD